MKLPDEESPLTEYEESAHAGMEQEGEEPTPEESNDAASPLGESLPQSVNPLDTYRKKSTYTDPDGGF